MRDPALNAIDVEDEFGLRVGTGHGLEAAARAEEERIFARRRDLAIGPVQRVAHADDVVASAAVRHVLAFAREDQVVAFATFQPVVAIASVEDVVAHATAEQALAARADQDVVALTASAAVAADDIDLVVLRVRVRGDGPDIGPLRLVFLP